MRVLGIAPDAKQFKWILVRGGQESPERLELPSSDLKLPNDSCEGHALLSLRRFLTTFLAEQNVEQISLLAAGTSKFGGPSVSRVKAEGIVQLVGAELDIAVSLVPAQSLRLREKRFESIAGNTPEKVLNRGQEFKSDLLRTAALVAWIGLTNGQ
jgi:hypothetical protein